VLTVVLGTMARIWHEPALPRSGGVWAMAGIAAVASVIVNNLPAAVVLSAHPTHHAQALLLGLDLGPNLAVTGSLSAVLWLSAARAVGGDASIAVYSRLGALLVPATLTAALVTSTAAARI
jgi:arsenical pump membrane protein